MRNSRTLCVLIVLCCFVPLNAFTATIAEWNFNSPIDDVDATTGTSVPSRGDGVLTLIGGATSTFGSVGGAGTSDPASSDNSQLRIRSLPRIDAANKGVGLEFTIATKGFEDLVLSWDQYNSRTASRFWRVQYTTDGFTWIDHQTVESTNASTWIRNQVSFADLAAADNRPYVSIR